MVFAGKVWRLLVGIKDALALLFLLLFFAVLFAALSARPGAGTVRDGALLLRLDGHVVEEPSVQDPFQAFASGQASASEYRARDLVHALRTAAGDDRIKAVVLDLSRFTGGGFVSLQDVARAMDRVRAAKKPVLVHGLAYDDDALLLAAHASEVWLDPQGGALVMGPGGNNLYFGGLLDRLKVTAHVFKVGTYKSAVEPWIRDSQSPEARENAQAVYSALFEAWKADVARARPKANIALATTNPAAWLRASNGNPAQAALAAGLVDRIGTEAEFGKRVAALVGDDPFDQRPGAYAHTSLRTWLSANPREKPGKAIGVITVAGEIVDGEAGPGTAGGDRVAGLLEDALDKDFAALVVRVDSPGGSILASEQIRNAIMHYKARGIPVVVSMANLAASGGYWVSTPAQTIFAEPGTITGSIGVFAILPTFERALAEYGVRSDGVQTTPLSGQPDLAAGLSPMISDMLQASVEHNYAQFLGLVSKARGKTPQQIDAMAQGRVWDGGTARQLGLVDRFGSLDDALAEAARLAKLGKGEWHPHYLGSASDPLSALLERMSPREDADTRPPAGDLVARIALRERGMLDRALAEVFRLADARGVMAYCLECSAEAALAPGPRAPQGAQGSWARLFAALRAD